MRNTAFLLRSAAAAAVLVALVGRTDARDPGVSPVALLLESVAIAPGIEHRIVVLHPLLATPATPAVPRPGASAALGGVATPELLAFGKPEKGVKPHVEAVNFADEPTALLVGDVLRTEVEDLAVARTTVVPTGKPTQVPFVRVSRAVEPDPKAIEPRMLGPVLPSPLRFLMIEEAPAVTIREACEKMAEQAHVADGRRSPADLPSAELIAKRVADYRKSFAALPKRSIADGREVVGCVVVIEGALASYETFADAKQFAAVWPRLLDGIAVEAALEEVRVNLLETDIPEPADPDRFRTDMKKRLEPVFAARTTERDVREEGRELDLALDGAVARALLLRDDRVVHFVLVTDPAHRSAKPPAPPYDPNAAARKMRPTEEEKRLGERRGGANPSPVPPPEPPPAPPPAK